MTTLVCRDYIFLLTSGQLSDAEWPLRLRAAHHRLICRHCRAFTRNDEAIDRIVASHKERVETLATPTDEADPPSAP